MTELLMPMDDLDRFTAPEHHPIAPNGAVAIILMQQLADQIRAQRERTGMSRADVAEKFGWSESKVDRMEDAEVGVSTNDLHGLFREFPIKDVATQNAMLDIARKVKEIKPSTTYNKIIPFADRPYWQYEAVAKKVAAYACESLIPDFLQTEAYAQAVEEAARAHATERYTDKNAPLRRQLRQQRAAHFLRPGGPALDVIIDEAVLMRSVEHGPDSVNPMLTIVQGMIRLNSAKPGDPFNENVTIRLASFDLGLYGLSRIPNPHTETPHPYTVLSIEDRPIAVRFGAILSESTSTGYTEKVRGYQAAFDELAARVLSAEDTNDRLQEYVRAL